MPASVNFQLVTLLFHLRGVGNLEQVIQAFKRRDAEERIPVLRLEIDYELVTLHDAMAEEDLTSIHASKYRLEQLRQEWIRLEV